MISEELAQQRRLAFVAAGHGPLSRPGDWRCECGAWFATLDERSVHLTAPLLTQERLVGIERDVAGALLEGGFSGSLADLVAAARAIAAEVAP